MASAASRCRRRASGEAARIRCAASGSVDRTARPTVRQARGRLSADSGNTLGNPRRHVGKGRRRSFPAPRRWLLPLAYRLLPWLARRQGVLHGRRLGFGGTEARGLIADWAAVGRSGRYAAAGTTLDLEAGMAALQLPVQAVVLADDWLGPASSLHGLLAHLPRAQAGIVVLDQQQLQVRADHFSWMRSPGTVASTLAEKIFDQTQKRC